MNNTLSLRERIAAFQAAYIRCIDTDQLDVADFADITGSARTTATEWRLKTTGELVRRDVWVNVLVGHLVGAQQG